MNKWAAYGLTGGLTFVVTSGTAFGSLLANGSAPNTWAIAGVLVAGVVAAAQAVQKQSENPPA